MSNSRLPDPFTPMLASSAPAPFDSPDFVFDIKWDGVRVLAFCEPGRTRLYSRTRRDVTHQYPEFADLHERLRVSDAVIDGEIVAPDTAGRPSFELLQQRIALTRPGDVRRAMGEVAVQMICFDLVFFDGDWITGNSLIDRLGSLAKALDFQGRVLETDPVEEKGVAFFEAARARGLEGIVAKRKTSHYLPGRRSRDWLKIKVVRQIDCVIGGWTPGSGSRSSTFGALLVGVYKDDGIHYIGAVGTGFDDRSLRTIFEGLRQLAADECPFVERPAEVREAHWVRPVLVCQVEYRELTSYFRLRAPSFKGLRPDKTPKECRIEGGSTPSEVP